jgi:hypothetical protein
MNRLDTFKRTSILFILTLLISPLQAQEIMDIDAFRDHFNSFENDMKVVVINDPSCGGCMYMVQEEEMPIFNDPKGCGLGSFVKYFFIWTDVLGADISHATLQAETYTDSRFFHYWDDDQLLGDLYMNTLDLIDPSGEVGAYTAWHTVMCYDAGYTWDESEENPPYPDFWQHKLADTYGADQSLYFNEETFAAGFNEMACALSIDDFPSELILNIYPNPSTGNFTIDFEAPKHNYRLVLHDILGNVISGHNLLSGTERISLTNLNSGLYICRVFENEKLMLTEKISVIR